ncbi:MAG: DNA glycosylase AlkZ-like family protein, partial [Candidatus Hermodarchaeota archaeon]
NNRLLIRGRPIKDWKDKRNKYALFHDYFPDVNVLEFDEQQAIELLVKKYIKAYGPVSENDIAWWSGLTKTKIREGLNHLEPQLERIQISELEGNYILYKKDLDLLEKRKTNLEPALTMLPELDPYPMGYKERERYLDPNYRKYVLDRSGNIAATILLDGRVIGVWDTEEEPEPTVKLHLIKPIKQQLLEELYSKAQKIGMFIFEKNVKIKEYESMIPLTERTAGGFMTPLKE